MRSPRPADGSIESPPKAANRSGPDGRFLLLFLIVFVVFVDYERSHFSISVIQRFLVGFERIRYRKICCLDRGIIVSSA